MSNNYIVRSGFGFDPTEVFNTKNINQYFDEKHADTPTQSYLTDITRQFQDSQSYYKYTHNIIEAALDYDDNIETYYYQHSFSNWNLLDGPETAIYLPSPDVIVGVQTDPMYTYSGAIHKLASAIANIAAHLNVESPKLANSSITGFNIIEKYLNWYDENHNYQFGSLQIIEETK